MKKKFFEMVKKYGVLDTKKYRYAATEYNDFPVCYEISRISLKDLESFNALGNWKTVALIS
jgi:hypothetical protein